MNGKKQKICLKIGIGLIISIIFFAALPKFTFDSVWYMGYLDYLDGTKPLNEWGAIRGFVFPLILFLGYKIHSGYLGINIVFYMLYITTFLYALSIVDIIRREVVKSVKYIYIDYILVTLFVFLNPIIWGYYHFVLTENVSFMFLIIVTYYSFNFFFKRINREDRRKDRVCYMAFSTGMLILTWFLKQSYFGIVAFIVIPLEIIVFVNQPTKKRLFYSCTLAIVMVISLSFSLKVWKNNTVPYVGGSLAKMICDLRYFERENKWIAGNQTISVKDNNWKEITAFQYDFEDNISSYITYVAKCMQIAPDRVIAGYWDNFMTLCGVYYRPREEVIDYQSGRIVKDDIWANILNKGEVSSISAENKTMVVSAIVNNSDNQSVIEGAEETLTNMGIFSKKVKNYYYTVGDNLIIDVINNRLSLSLAYIAFSVLTCTAPMLFIFFIYKSFRKKNAAAYAIEIVICFFSALYLCMNAFLGEIIDRYAVQVYMAQLLLVVIFIGKFIVYIGLRKEECNEKETENISETGKCSELKLLIVIPAYNEAVNIERVVDNLLIKYPQFDYLVVNDGSRDNTAQICREKNYCFLDLPVNLGLAGAVQAGMKYAVRHGYDAVLQFDGDGQHRAEYIKDMEQVMLNKSVDIVIGSRFLNKKKPFSPRMLGSRVISFIIRITTGQRITDPTSGMRLYGKNVLKEFAESMNYGPEPDTISYLIKKKGIKVRETQVSMDERIAGESYLNIFRSMEYMILMCFSIIFIQQFRRGK